MLQTYQISEWHSAHSSDIASLATTQLEHGNILYFPQLAFTLSSAERVFLSPHYANPRAKNIGYDAKDERMWGMQNLNDEEHLQLKAMLARYCSHAYQLVKSLFPTYINQLQMGRTSFRPVQVSDRKSSYRKDDKRLHVDAFPSSPNQGKRILRVFCNVNPNNEERVWRIGENFENVAARFIPQIPKPLPGFARGLHLLKITKSYRTAYDHYMLHMHDRMKGDEHYQKNVAQQEVRFPTNTTWIVQTDHVSHAAMSGQHLLEQTFYLPVEAMVDESKSPLRVLEGMLKRELV